MYAHLHMEGMDRQQRLDKVIEACGASIRLNRARSKRIDKQIEIEEKRDPIDQRLRAIVEKYERQETGFCYGMAGAAQLFAGITDPDRYKAHAAKHLLRLRHIRRWHMAHRGNKIGNDTYNKLLADAAFCRRRAAGQEPMPVVKMMSF